MPRLDLSRPVPTKFWLVRFGLRASGHAEPPRLFWTAPGLERFLEAMEDERVMRLPGSEPKWPSKYDVWEIDLTTGRVRPWGDSRPMS